MHNSITAVVAFHFISNNIPTPLKHYQATDEKMHSLTMLFYLFPRVAAEKVEWWGERRQQCNYRKQVHHWPEVTETVWWIDLALEVTAIQSKTFLRLSMITQLQICDLYYIHVINVCKIIKKSVNHAKLCFQKGTLSDNQSYVCIELVFNSFKINKNKQRRLENSCFWPGQFIFYNQFSEWLFLIK